VLSGRINSFEVFKESVRLDVLAPVLSAVRSAPAFKKKISSALFLARILKNIRSDMDKNYKKI
jgi:hypothetical protein